MTAGTAQYAIARGQARQGAKQEKFNSRVGSMTAGTMTVEDFAAKHPLAWETVKASHLMPELGYSELGVFLRKSTWTVRRHLELFRRSLGNTDLTDITDGSDKSEDRLK